MLGWFKKKFGKQPEQTVAEVQEAPAAPVQELELPPTSVGQPETVEVAAEPGLATAADATEIASPSPELTAVAPVDEPTAAAVPEALSEVVEQVEPALTMPQDVEPAVQEQASLEEEPVHGGEAAVEPPSAAVEISSEVLEPSPPETETATNEAAAAAEREPAGEGDGTSPTISAAMTDEVEATGDQREAEEAEASPATGKIQEKPKNKSLFQRLQERLGKTRDALVYRLDRLFLGKKEIDQDLFEQLEEILIMADLGVATTLELIDVARKKVKRDQLRDPQALKEIIREQILAYIEASEQPAELVLPEEGPFVIMVVGVNGVGKTTTIGKLAAKFVRSGQSVLLVAGDTFRAAAINQLTIWAERVGVEIVAQKPGADPSSVVFDGLTHGMAHGHDVIIIDTAGRLHTSVNLMEELKKIKRVIGKKLADAPHEIMLVLDATTGQNGISQAKLFHEAVGVTGLALTKLDGTAKGGIVANICRETKIPVRFIGIGEQLDDLRDFEAKEFVEALFTSQPH